MDTLSEKVSFYTKTEFDMVAIETCIKKIGLWHLT
jgi:hypothetical protein